MLVLMLAGIVHGVDLGHAVGQVTEQPRPDLGVDTFAGGQESGDFIHAFTESGAIFSQNSGVGIQGSGHLSSLEVPEMLHRHLQDVRLLQFGVSGAILFESVQDESFQLSQTLVDSGSSPFFHNWLRGLSVLGGCLGFIGGCVHACRGCSDRRGGGFFHHIGRHLLLLEISHKTTANYGPLVQETRGER